ncbi:HlyD family type I secretion periplasmic adaptor subunit [Amphritea sp.]|uniref:HlyD family type I secretion periplasmic adaptor subunit n=1 Tax=Amphritea sp. TaxID=1872502 RepID=UPI0025BEA76B|nr:HlyD family type I secretion periplasmic adaptor subunit [Amphritea sp.]
MNEVYRSRIMFRIIAGLIVSFVVWATFFKIDIASHSIGEVVVAGQTKLVQHLEGGIVRSILVNEGARVAVGDPLIEMESVGSDAELHEIQSAIGALEIKMIRLKAQIDNAERLVVPAALLAAYPEQASVAGKLFQAQKSRLQGGVESHEQRLIQKQSESKELLARKKYLKRKLGILRQQIAINDKLRADGIVNEYDNLNLLKEEQSVLGSLSELVASITRSQAAESEARIGLSTLSFADDEKMQAEMETARKQLNEFQSRIGKYQDNQQRTIVRSPIDGTVLTLHVVTQGGVVAPGGAILSLVPGDDALLIEARLPVGDVGLIKTGQVARIQLMSATARGFQAVNGRVVQISPDSIVERGEEPYYQVKISPDESYFKLEKSIYPLVPGVMVSVAVYTGNRSVLAYFLEPFTQGMSNAFSEP